MPQEEFFLCHKKNSSCATRRILGPQEEFLYHKKNSSCETRGSPPAAAAPGHNGRGGPPPPPPQQQDRNLSGGRVPPPGAAAVSGGRGVPPPGDTSGYVGVQSSKVIMELVCIFACVPSLETGEHPARSWRTWSHRQWPVRDLCQKSSISLDNKNPYILWSVHFMVKGRICLESTVSHLIRVVHIR